MNGILAWGKGGLTTILLVALSAFAQDALALTCTSNASGNWSANATWTSCGGNAPGAGDTAIIANTHTVTVNNNTTVGAVTVNTGGTLDVGANFTVNGVTNISGTLSHSTTGGNRNYNGLVTINAGGSWENAVGENITFRGGLTHNGASFTTGTGRMDFRTNNQTISGTSPITFSGADALRIRDGITLTNNASVTISTGLLFGNNVASTWVNGVNATLNYANATAPMTSGTLGVFTASAAGNTVNYNGVAQAVRLPSASTYYHLALSGSGAKTLPAAAMIVNGNFTMSGTATTTAAGALTVGGNFTVGAGTIFAANTFSHSVGANFSNSGTFTANTSTFTFNGAAAQSITGVTTFRNLTINNTSGLTINNNVTVSSVLNLTSGNISTGANILIMTPNCNTAGAVVRTSGYVLGNLRKTVPTGTPVTCTWEVGGAINYAPVTNTFALVISAGTLTVRTDDGDHADTTAGTSGIGSSCSVNRRWTLTPAIMVVTTYSPVFTFVNPGDLDSGIDPTSTSFIVRKKDVGVWISPTMGTRTSTSTQATGITNAEGFGEFALGYSAATCINHFAISHGGSAVNCQAENITIAAHDATHAIATTYTGTITLSTSTGKGDWSVVTASGTLLNGTANDGAATYTFVAADNGVVVLGLKDTVAETVNIGVTNGTQTDFSGISPGTATAIEDANLVFAASGFRISDGAAIPAAAIIATQIAGTTSATYALQAIRTDLSTGACVGVFASGTDVTVDLASQCNDPIACIAGQNVAITNNASTANIASNANSGVTSYTARSLRFGANSQAFFTLNYPDVGQISLHARYNIPLGSGGASATNMLGSSNQFVVKPSGFVLSAIQQTAAPNLSNPAAANATGAKFVKAGEAFRATVSAVNSANNATPNYGKEVVPEGVVLARSLVSPLSGASGTLANPAAFGSFSAGVATGTTFNWNEVGIITLTPSVGDGSYLGVGDVTGTSSGNVGRFYPNHFDTAVVLSAGVPIPCLTGCPTLYNGMVYSGQAFSTQVIAKNLAGAATTNYDGTLGYAKVVTLTAWNALGSIVTQNPSGSLTNGTIAAATFSAGVATTTTPVYTLATALTAPTNIFMRADEATDTVSSLRAVAANSIEGGVQVVSGRVKVSNAYGSELLPLKLTATVQLYTASGWVTSSNDTVTSLTLAATYNLLKNSIITGTTAASKIPASGLSAGKLTINLAKPSSGATGEATIAPTAPGYLPVTSGTATFGVYKGSNNLIYQRENY